MDIRQDTADMAGFSSAAVGGDQHR